MESTLKRTWVEIDLDALSHNYRTLRTHMGSHALLLGVVKADAYGHGAVQTARALEELGSEYLAVSSVDEARELRLSGIKLPILQLGLTDVDQTGVILENHITQTVWDEASARAFSAAAVRLGRRMRVHIKLDTGMSRLGFPCGEEDATLESLCRVCALPGLEAEGIFTHFASSDDLDEESRAFTLLQHQRFAAMLRRLEDRGVTFRLRHCANSGAAVNYPEFAYDMFRPGIVLYGVGPLARKLGLWPLMALKTVVGAVNTFGPGTPIGYGRTFHTQRTSRVGVLPIGYADGLHRSLSNCWRVWTAQGAAPIVGRICMDMCMVDLTDLADIRTGDVVEVYGLHNPVDEAAELAGTISYELTCSVSKRVPRIYYRGGREVQRELLLRG